MTYFLHYQVQDTRHKEVIALKANMNSDIRLEMAAIFSIEPLSKTGYCQSVYVMFDFICMGLLELRELQNEKIIDHSGTRTRDPLDCESTYITIRPSDLIYYR